MKRFSEKERECAAAFSNGEGRYWHAYTNGKQTSVLFGCDSDYRFAMNVIAQTAYVFPEIKLVSFEVMSNHFHFLCISEKEGHFREFFSKVSRRLARSIPAMKGIQLYMKPIADLKTMRNTIVYINRNGYLADSRYSPFSYPWGTGRFYFHQFPMEADYGEIPYTEKRVAFRGRVPDLPACWPTIDGYISPVSYCAIDFGMAMFRNAQHYFWMLGRNVESFAGIAVEIDDTEFLTDSELYEKVYRMLRDEYKVSSTRELSNALKLELARILRNAYRSSNAQISRVLNLSMYEVNALFPLTAKD